MWQMGGLGPMLGQNHHFSTYAPEKIPYAIDRYVKETSRLYGVLDKRLGNRKFIVGDSVTLADYSIGSCLTYWQPAGMPLPEFKHLKDWFTHLETTEAWKKSAGRAR